MNASSIRRQRRRLIAAAAAILTLAGGARAQAPSSRRLAVSVQARGVPVEVAGAIDAAVRREVEARGMAVTPTPAGIGACGADEADCFRGALASSGADQAIVIAIGAREKALDDVAVTARLIDGRTGEQLALGQRLCEAGCPLGPGLDSMIAEMTGELVASGDAGESVPAPVAAAEPLSSGPSQPPVALEVAERRSLSVIKVIPIAAGVGAIVTGFVLVAIDGPRIDDGVRQPDERATATPGYVAIGGGVALVATGVLLWWLDGEPTDRVLAPAASQTASGAWIVGAEGRF
jgi:hypothetical protein